MIRLGTAIGYILLAIILMTYVGIAQAQLTTQTQGGMKYRREGNTEPPKVFLTQQDSKVISSTQNLIVPSTIQWAVPVSAGSSAGYYVTADVMGIDNCVFRNSGILKSASFTRIGTQIGAGAFESCNQLSSITIPDSTLIKEVAFYNCTKLKELELPENVTINAGAFFCCSGLENIKIPRNTKFVSQTVRYTMPGINLTVTNRAFGNCNLKTVTAVNPVPVDAPEDTFFGSYDATLIVPKGSGKLYKAAKEWERFSNVIEDDAIGALYEVSFAITDGGSVAVDGHSLAAGDTTLNYEKDSNIDIMIVPEPDYYVTEFDINGVSYLSELTDNSFKLNDIKSDTIIVVRFESVRVGIDIADSATFKIYKEGNVLIIDSEIQNEFIIADARGVIVYKGTSNRIPLTKGLYFVRQGNRSFKIIM